MKKIILFSLSIFIPLFSSDEFNKDILKYIKPTKVNPQSHEITEKQKILNIKYINIYNKLLTNFDNKKYIEVLHLIKTHLKNMPDEIKQKVTLLKSKCLFKLKKYRSNIKYLKKNISNNSLTKSNLGFAYIYLMESYLTKKNFTQFHNYLKIIEENFQEYDKNIIIQKDLLLTAYYLHKKNYIRGMKLVENILYKDSTNLEDATEAGFYLSVIKDKLGKKEESIHLMKQIIKHNSTFFIDNPQLIIKYPHLFKIKELSAFNSEILLKILDEINFKDNPRIFKNITKLLKINLLWEKRYKDLQGTMKKLVPHILNLEILTHETHLTIDEMSLKVEEVTFDKLFEKYKSHKQDLNYFKLVELQSLLKDEKYFEIIKNIKFFKHINSNIFKKRRILNKQDFLRSLYFDLLTFYLSNKSKNNISSSFTNDKLEFLLKNTETSHKKILLNDELNINFLKLFKHFSYKKKNRELFELFKNNPDYELNKALIDLYLLNDDFDFIIKSSQNFIKNNKKLSKSHFLFYYYLVQSSIFEEQPFIAKKYLDILINNETMFNNPMILDLLNHYHHYVNDKKPFKDYNDNELVRNIYNYINMANKYKGSKHTPNFYFLLIDNLSKNNDNPKNIVFLLNKLFNNEDLTTKNKAKGYYYFKKNYILLKDTKNIELYNTKCSKLKTELWAKQCLKLK